MNRGRADAFITTVLADISIFAAITEDNDRLALQGRFDSQLDAAQRGVIERGFAAVGQVFNGGVEPLAVSREVNDLAHVCVEGDDRDRIVRLERLNIAARGRLRLGQRPVGHAAAGVHDQHGGEIQVVVGDVLDIADSCQALQVATNEKVFHVQARHQPFALVQYAGVNDNLAQIS